MEVIFKNSFNKELLSCPSYVVAKVGLAVEQIVSANDSLAQTTLDFQKLKGPKKGHSYYKIRIGDYRIGIEYLDKSVTFLTIFHRQENYKSFPPK